MNTKNSLSDDSQNNRTDNLSDTLSGDIPTDRNNIPGPNAQVAQRIEELLKEQLYELGIDVKKLNPEEIAQSMKCHVAPDKSMTYFWKNKPLLDVVPEVKGDSVAWRMFTKDDIK